MRMFAALSAILILTAPAPAQEEGRKNAVGGVVKAVDAKAGTITLAERKRDGGQVDPEKTFKIDPNVKVTIDGETKALKDVPAGKPVTLSLGKDQQSVIAVTLGGRKREGGEKPGGRKGKAITGLLTRVEGGTLTVTQRGDGGEKSHTLTLDAAAKVQVQTAEDMTVKGEGGKERKVPEVKDGTTADLQVGKQVTVTLGDGEKAVQVLVLRPAARKREGEKPR